MPAPLRPWTKFEKAVAVALLDGWQMQVKIGRFTVDFVNEKLKIVVEALGCFHHGCETCVEGRGKKVYPRHLSARVRDELKKKFLEEQGYRVVYVRLHEFKEFIRKDGGGI